MNCAIWGTDITDEKPKTGDRRVLNSPRAGGWYEIDGSAEATAKSFSQDERLAVTRWLVAQRAIGIETPKLTGDNIGSAKIVRKRSFTERVNALLLSLGKIIDSLDKPVQIQRRDETGPTQFLMAETDSKTAGDLAALATVAVDMGLLSEFSSGLQYIACLLTAAGWERIEKLEMDLPKSEQAFVAMWFNLEMDDAYKNGIYQAIERAGYRPMRIDKKEHANKVDDEIVAEIRRSRFVVADFTCAPEKVRGGVYFEAGLAMGLGMPVIWTAKSTSEKDLHFDTRQYNHIMWDTPTDLSKKLEQRIRAVLGAGPLAPN